MARIMPVSTRNTPSRWANNNITTYSLKKHTSIMVNPLLHTWQILNNTLLNTCCQQQFTTSVPRACTFSSNLSPPLAEKASPPISSCALLSFHSDFSSLGTTTRRWCRDWWRDSTNPLLGTKCQNLGSKRPDSAIPHRWTVCSLTFDNHPCFHPTY